MLHPSYTELMEKINKEGETGEEPVINSRYSIVIATSKRAREIIGGDEENMEDEEHLSSEEFEELGEVDPAFTNVE